MKKLLLSLSILAFPFFLWAQSKNDSTGYYSYLGEVIDTVPNESFFEIDEPLPITLKYDITSFVKNKRDGEYLDAVLTVEYQGVEPISKNIRIKARGNFRRGECFFPPLFLNFKTSLLTRLSGIFPLKKAIVFSATILDILLLVS